MSNRSRSRKEGPWRTDYGGREEDFARDMLGLAHPLSGALMLWEAQRYIFRAVFEHRFVAVSACRSAGKSFLLGGVVAPTFFCTGPSRVLMLAPTLDQVKDVLWAKIESAWQGASVQLPGTVKKLRVELDSEHSILAVPTRNPGRVRGYHAGIIVPSDPDSDTIDPEELERMIEITGDATRLLIVVDEPEDIDPEVFRVLRGMTNKPNVYMVMIGNPYMGLDDDHEYVRAFRDRPNKWHTVKISSLSDKEAEKIGVPPDPLKYDKVFDHVPEYLVSRESVEDSMKSYEPGDPVFLSDICGRFSPGSVTSLVVTRTILDAAEALYERNKKQLGPSIGVDIGTAGDLSVACLLFDGDLIAVDAWRPGRDDLEAQVTIAKRIVAQSLKWGREIKQMYGAERWNGDPIPGSRIHIDDTGIVGVCDILARDGYFVDRVQFGGKPGGDHFELVQGTNFKNCRAEMYWVARRGLQEGTFRVRDDVPLFNKVRQQLQWTHFERESSQDGPIIKLESKEKIRNAHAGTSPDYADAFVLACRENMDDQVMFSSMGTPIFHKSKPQGSRLPGSRRLA